MSRIVEAFNLTPDDLRAMHQAVSGGPGAFGDWVRLRLYIPDADDD